MLYVNRGPPANTLVARQDHAKFAPREADTDCLRELDEAKVAVQTAKEEIESIVGATAYFKSWAIAMAAREASSEFPPDSNAVANLIEENQVRQGCA